MTVVEFVAGEANRFCGRHPVAVRHVLIVTLHRCEGDGSISRTQQQRIVSLLGVDVVPAIPGSKRIGRQSSRRFALLALLGEPHDIFIKGGLGTGGEIKHGRLGAIRITGHMVLLRTRVIAIKIALPQTALEETYIHDAMIVKRDGSSLSVSFRRLLWTGGDAARFASLR